MAEDDMKKSKEGEAPVAEAVRAPPPPPAPMGPPGPPDYYQKPPFQPSGYASNKLLFFFIILGLVCLLIGSIMIQISPNVGSEQERVDKVYDQDTDSEEMDKYEAEVEDSQDNTMDAGTAFFNLGLFFILMFLLLAGTFRDDVHLYLRIMFLITATLILRALVAPTLFDFL